MLITGAVAKDLGREKFEEYPFENKYEFTTDVLKLSDSLKGGGFSVGFEIYKNLTEELAKKRPSTKAIRALINAKPLEARWDVIEDNLKRIYAASYDTDNAIVIPNREDLLRGYLPRLGDYVARFLAAVGIRDIYGVPGGASEALSDALSRHGDIFDAVLTSHEATAAYLAALGKVKLKWEMKKKTRGKIEEEVDHRELDIGVCFTTTRPGIRNLLPGIDYAFVTKRSCVAITAGSMPSTIGKRAFQETDTDILDLFDSITCYNTAITDPGQLISKLHTAFWEAILNREPAHINVSSLILNTPVTLLNPIIMPKYNIPRRSLERDYSDEVNARGERNLRDFMTLKDNPLLYIGVQTRRDLEEILEFSEVLNIPFVTSPEGRDLVGYHPSFCGALGMAGQESAMEAVAKSDLILAINPGAGQFSGVEKMKDKIFIHLATYPDTFGVTAEYADAQILGNPGIIFKGALKYLQEHGLKFKGENFVSPYYIEYESTIGKNEPVHFADAIKFWRDTTPPTTHFHYDIGTSMLAGIHYDRPKEPGTSRVETKDGAMTVGIYEALGKAIEFKRDAIEEARAQGAFMDLAPEHQKDVERDLKTPLVIVFTGDGSTFMSSNEFVCARRLGLNILFIIVNNQYLQMVHQGQKEGEKELFCNSLSPDGKVADFATIAEGSGVEGYRVEKYDDFDKLPLDHIINHQGVKVLNMRTSLASMPMTQRLIQLKTE